MGEPFDRDAVLHTMRHLAMRAGWTLRPRASHRIVYITCAGKEPGRDVAAGDLLVLSSPEVAEHMHGGAASLPLRRDSSGGIWPYPHPCVHHPRLGRISDDVIAGFHAVVNLWWERRVRSPEADGWIRSAEDWWARQGLASPEPFADQWLARLATEAKRVGWPCPEVEARPAWVLTHDVDYLPGPFDLGLPRALRAVARQLVTRRRPWGAAAVPLRYVQTLPRRLPYAEAIRGARREAQWEARSSFQFVVSREHPADPHYPRRPQALRTLLRDLRGLGSEVCLHGSYSAARRSGRLGAEKEILEGLLGEPVRGHRQHYLNFHPAGFFRELERARFRYDMSVGYNDRSGPRAGTVYPYRPYDLERRRPHDLWEIPFVLMDSTLATSYRFGAADALAHATTLLDGCRGMPSLIWHAEQLGGLLDPGFDRVYFDLLKWARDRSIRLLSGEQLLPELDAAWSAAGELS